MQSGVGRSYRIDAAEDSQITKDEEGKKTRKKNKNVSVGITAG